MKGFGLPQFDLKNQGRPFLGKLDGLLMNIIDHWSVQEQDLPDGVLSVDHYTSLPK